MLKHYRPDVMCTRVLVAPGLFSAFLEGLSEICNGGFTAQLGTCPLLPFIAQSLLISGDAACVVNSPRDDNGVVSSP